MHQSMDEPDGTDRSVCLYCLDVYAFAGMEVFLSQQFRNGAVSGRKRNITGDLFVCVFPLFKGIECREGIDLSYPACLYLFLERIDA